MDLLLVIWSLDTFAHTDTAETVVGVEENAHFCENDDFLVFWACLLFTPSAGICAA